MSYPQIKDKQTADLADQLIGAAQELERAARRLKDDARTIRAAGLTQYLERSPVESTRDWSQTAIKAAAVYALRAVGCHVDHLSEISWSDPVDTDGTDGTFRS